jgi:hypothetical protein
MKTPSIPSIRLSRFIRTPAVFSAILIGSLSASGATTPVFSDDFEDGNRAGWYNNAASTSLGPSNASATHKLTGNALSIMNSTATGLGYFTPVTLGVGESLTFSFNMSLTAVSDVNGGLVFGLFNSSTGPKATADNQSGTNDYSAYQGYRAFSNPGSGATSLTSIGKREAGQSPIIDGSYTALAGGIGQGVNLAAATPYAVLLTIARTGETSISMTYTINGLSFTGTDGAATNFTFDTFAWKKGNVGGTLYLDDIAVSYTSSIPEPSTAALLAGLGIGVLAVAARRKRS